MQIIKEINLFDFQNREEILNYAMNNDIINISDVLKNINVMERKEILKRHPYKIWQGKDGKWRTYVSDELKNEGRRLISKSDLSNLEEAIVEDYKVNHEQRTKIFQIFEDWMDYARETDSLSLSTISRYQNDYERFISHTEFSTQNITTIGEDDVLKFLKGIVIKRSGDDKLTKKCFTNIKIVINGLFTYAKSEKELTCISINDALQNFKIADRHFKYVIHKDSEQVYDDKEINILASHIVKSYINRRYRGTRELGILFAALTGIRVGELASLKITDEEHGKLYIQRTESKGKDQNNRTVVFIKDYPKTVESMNGIELTDSALEVWGWIKKTNYMNGIHNEYIFYEEEFGRLKTHHFNAALKRICKESGIPFKSIHKLRKTYSSMLFANNVEKKIVQSQMRHRNISTTEKHYDFSMRSREYKREQLNKADVLNVKNIEYNLMKVAK